MDDETVTQVWLSVHKLKVKDGEDIEPPKTDVILVNDEEGIKFLFSVFKIVKNELVESEKITKEITSKYLKILAVKFGKNEDLSGVLAKKIKKLEKYKFYKGVVEISSEELVEALESLRYKRIRFWKAIFKNYVENKDEFNEELKSYNGEYF